MIQNSSAKGEDIQEILDLLEPALDGRPRQHVLIACLSVCIMLQRPDFDADELRDAVYATSQWLCMYLSQVDGLDLSTDVPKGKLN